MAHFRGFTIIELLVVLAIIGLLVAAASLSFGSAQRTGRDAQRMGDVISISKAVDQAASNNGGAYPGKYYSKSSTGIIDNHVIIDETCAQYINSVSTFIPVPIAVSQFKNGSIPQDPLPLDIPSDPNNAGKSGTCAFPNFGYIYQTHYEESNQLSSCPGMPYACSMAIQLKLDYLLELSLENSLPPDLALFQTFKPSDLDITINGTRTTELFTQAQGFQSKSAYKNNNGGGRFVYYLPGPYCGDSCYTH